ncbi:hypothetical protein ANCCAN_11915 [Ancylostoma caninum]|uniref:Tc1-like transposase DDE domain-containing protein n=1 Tax=Ancylostoma caninum TaxID=29170 RepID=A0A368GCN9_ANCCA|nr:hypothetical protein ANCCAN_11915 [Ancylostoma caninum]
MDFLAGLGALSRSKTHFGSVQAAVSDPWGKDVWPSNSPGLNPVDFSVWSILEAKLSSSRCDTIGGLKRALKQAWDEITEEQVAGIVNNFLKRWKACGEAKGGHFEHLM